MTKGLCLSSYIGSKTASSASALLNIPKGIKHGFCCGGIWFKVSLSFPKDGFTPGRQICFTQAGLFLQC